MLKILNRKEKQSFESALREFPSCHFLMIMDDIMVDAGYIIAVSEEPATHDEMCDLRHNYPTGTLFFIGGIYEPVASIKF